ncbi:ABC transporter substrate-binding protein [Aldersonia sp. NBC_00410]|uniref:ABC transporter substrate-binding protein n=1 Tax=Aldersonia sp. NBC_00410 TaxID=2975954 RepID=UPI00225478E3|nr:ABC transporter substrate-binding protein [Aldersonia sp. NBC_00410]MCX5044157.1 ABC transporter substrate-binding protein [Aldersonia sp. NBC_00410]
MFRARILVAGVLAAGVLAGCSQGQQIAATDGPSGDPQKGGTVVYSDVMFVTDALSGFYSTGNLLLQVVDRLVYVDPSNGAITPWLAEEFSRNDNATQYTFKIRDGVTFSDGTPLTAEVVKANLDQVGKGDQEKKIPAFTDFVGYDRSEVAGNTVTVFLSKPNANFYRALAGHRAGIRGLSTLALNYENQAKIENVVGSGAFVYESQVPDQKIVLKRRDGYAWPPAVSPNKGAAYLDKLEIRAIGEPGLRAGAVQSKQVDVARGIQPTDEAGLTAAGKQVVPVTAPLLTSNIAAVRIGNEEVSDVRVRKALQLGIDRQALVDTVLSDNYQAADSVLNHDDPAFTDLSKEIAYDPDEARRLLDEAGWKVGSDGIREKDGKKLALSLSASVQSVVMRPAVEFLESQWRELGISLVNLAGDTTAYNIAISDPTKPLLGTRTGYNNGLSLLFGRDKNTMTFVPDNDLIALSTDELSSTDAAKQKEVLGQVQEQIVDKHLALVLWDEVQVHAASQDLHIDFDTLTEPLFQSAWKASQVSG